jgi:transcriptional regulator with XRE-family HTH domain
LQRSLLLKERIQGLRKDRGLTLADVEKGTGIPKSTLQRLEVDSPDMNAQETRVGYQDIVASAKFYDVSADYLCGLTENLRFSNTAVDKLHLSDEAVAVLMNGKLNTRLLSDLITHPEFVGLLAALEVYIDDLVAPKIAMTNKVMDMVVGRVTKRAKTTEPDEIMAALLEANTDPDDYVRYRLTRRFDKIAQALYEAAHKPQEETESVIVKMFGDQLDKYEDTLEKTGSAEEAKLAVLADQMGVDYKKTPDTEKQSLLSMFGRSKFARFFKKRK